MKHALRRPSGFTLIELMIVVAIIGILASVAMPQYNLMQMRSRTAERSTILDAVARAAGDTVTGLQMLPDPADRSTWAGIPNPVGVPTASKRTFQNGLAGWRYLPVVVQGDCYYSYSFLVEDPGAGAGVATMTVTAEGDLDGDTGISTKELAFKSEGYVFYKTGETPVAGLEDKGTF